MLLEYLREVVFVPDHQNILEDYLWIILRSNEMAAALRVFTLFDLLLSRPMRYLSGKSCELDDWSIFKMNPVFDMIEMCLITVAEDGSALFDPALDFFEDVANEQPRFDAWRKDFFATKIKSPDGTTYAVYKEALDEARNPTNVGYQQATNVSIELAQVRSRASVASAEGGLPAQRRI